MSQKLVLSKIVILLLMTCKLYAFEKDAEQLIQFTTSKAKEIILDNNIKIDEKKEKIEKIALDVVDVDGLGRFTLGAFRKDLNDEQLKEYTKVFRIFFAKNISSRLRNYSDQNIEVVDAKKINDNYVMVKSQMISKNDNQKIRIDWRVFKVKDKLVVRDLVIEGLSLAKTQREEFNSILSSKGYDGLIIILKDFISKN